MTVRVGCIEEQPFEARSGKPRPSVQVELDYRIRQRIAPWLPGFRHTSGTIVADSLAVLHKPTLQETSQGSWRRPASTYRTA
jgi:hypothetical protein